MHEQISLGVRQQFGKPAMTLTKCPSFLRVWLMAAVSVGALSFGLPERVTAAQSCGVNFVKVAAGGEHTCGIKDDGSVECWGSNDYGESTPPAGTFVGLASGGSSVGAFGYDHTCVSWLPHSVAA